MEELLKELFESQVLTADTRVELEKAFKSQLDTAISEAKEEAAADVKATLTEQWINERDALIDAIDRKVDDMLREEVEELKVDIERFRDLEAEYAEKLVEAKKSMSSEVKRDMRELVEKIDSFLEIRLAQELEELKEDIKAVRQNEFGRKIVEAFAEEFQDYFFDSKSVKTNVREMEKRLAEASEALEESETKLNTLTRKMKLDELLKPLNGRQRDIMETILKNVDTDQLEEGYKTFVGRVLRETAEISEKESSDNKKQVLAEKETKKPEVKVVTGDNKTLVENEAKQDKPAVDLSSLLKIAGIQ